VLIKRRQRHRQLEPLPNQKVQQARQPVTGTFPRLQNKTHAAADNECRHSDKQWLTQVSSWLEVSIDALLVWRIDMQQGLKRMPAIPCQMDLPKWI